MKRVAILTITDKTNYGNKLQNYALSQILKNIGCLPETVLSISKKKEFVLKTVLKSIVKFLRTLKKHKDIISHKKYYKYYKYQVRSFNKFVKNYIPVRKFNIYTGCPISNKTDMMYDYFICGSDQIWNPLYGTTTPLMFAEGASNTKKISFSASFGINKLPANKACEYANYLKTFKALSVREEAGKAIIKEICNRDAEVLVDPTMMLTKTEWIKIEKKPKWYNGEAYVLTYILGEQNDKTKKILGFLSKEKKLKVVNLFDARYCSHDKKEYFAAAPDEFIWLIRNANIVITDSFHACVFSIIMKTPFVVCERGGIKQSIGSRIDTLLEKFDLNSRRDNSINLDNIFDIDYSGADAIFDTERKKVQEFLNKALDL